MKGMTRRTFRSDGWRYGTAMSAIVVLCCVVAATLSTAALADPPPCGSDDKAPAQAADTDAQEPESKAPRVRIVPATDIEEAKAKAAAKPSEPAQAGAAPKWACDASTIKLESIWAGKPLEATWSIRNDGAGDLEITLKGG